jgi:hypothetical protein
VKDVLIKAKLFIEENDLRFAATLLGHLVAAGDQAGGTPDSRLEGQTLLADVLSASGSEVKMPHGETFIWHKQWI